MDDEIPSLYDEAVSSAEKDDCMKVMANEMKSHSKNKTWDLVPRPNDRKVIRSR